MPTPDDRLVAAAPQIGNPPKAAMVAVDAATGAKRWETEGPRLPRQRFRAGPVLRTPGSDRTHPGPLNGPRFIAVSRDPVNSRLSRNAARGAPRHRVRLPGNSALPRPVALGRRASTLSRIRARNSPVGVQALDVATGATEWVKREGWPDRAKRPAEVSPAPGGVTLHVHGTRRTRAFTAGRPLVLAIDAT